MQVIPFLFLSLFATAVVGQKESKDRLVNKSPYQVNWIMESVPSLAVLGITSIGFRKLRTVSEMTKDQVSLLNGANINSFDRPAINFDPIEAERAHENSDVWLNVSTVTPVLLMLKKSIRKDALKIAALYLENHAVNTLLYQGAAFSIRKPRPAAYNTTIPLDERFGQNLSNSFFSGHVSTTSASTFFTAKVFNDYSSFNNWGKAGIYSIAAIPPAVVAYYRVKAGKHFKTDVMVGYLVGAATGILIPHIHKKKDRTLSFVPYYDENKNVGFSFSVNTARLYKGLEPKRTF